MLFAGFGNPCLTPFPPFVHKKCDSLSILVTGIAPAACRIVALFINQAFNNLMS